MLHRCSVQELTQGGCYEWVPNPWQESCTCHAGLQAGRLLPTTGNNVQVSYAGSSEPYLALLVQGTMTKKEAA